MVYLVAEVFVRYPDETVYPASQALSAMLDLMVAPIPGAVIRAFTMRINQQDQDKAERESLYSTLAHHASLRGYSLHVLPVPKCREFVDRSMQYQYHTIWLLKENVA